MSPSTRSRKPTVRAHERSEIVTAVLVGTGIVLVVLLLIWLLRPADPTKLGSGGLFTRQPRATLLIFLGAGALAWALWWVRKGHRRPKRLDSRNGMVVVAVVVIIGIVLAAIFWPGGLIKHWPKQPKPIPENTSSTVAPTTAPGSTTKGSTPNGSTTPTTAATTTPTTGGK